MSVKHMGNICGIFYKTVVNLKFIFFKVAGMERLWLIFSWGKTDKI